MFGSWGLGKTKSSALCPGYTDFEIPLFFEKEEPGLSEKSCVHSEQSDCQYLFAVHRVNLKKSTHSFRTWGP